MEHTNCHSPGDFEENDTFLKKLQDEKHILALCDVTISIFKCTTIYYRYLSIHCLQSFLLNVKILFSYQADLGSLLLIREIIKADNKDLTRKPTKKKNIRWKMKRQLSGMTKSNQ
ncbi:hypothetical protein MTR_0030s0150 [Medicago truncatula]|uniref:Uncharacterized protein n=1 Tax=Medicago truncatula TaxID=3880 RepID=A0A072TJ29_MEDTR|nr:hypothetical protein MTR_0030s0150 [Medicago truncatula]